jgi:hypothetical protein
MARLCIGCALLFLSGCERPDVRFPQFVQDGILVSTITSELSALLENQLSGRPVGDTSFAAPCGGGGNAQATGTLRADGTADLELELDTCGINYAGADGSSTASLIIAGPMTFAFLIDQATGFTRQELQSDELEISGALTDQNEERQVNDVCAISATVVTTEVSIALLGSVCGRDATSSLAHVSCGQ